MNPSRRPDRPRPGRAPRPAPRVPRPVAHAPGSCPRPAPRRPAPSWPGPGYTLIELLVVIMLLAVVLTMVFFTISRVSPTQRVKAAATQLGSDFDELRHWAAVSGKKHAILYDLDAHRYALLIPRQVRSEEDRAQLEKSREEGEAETLELLAWHDFPSFLNNSVRITEVVFSRRDVRGSGQVRVEVSPKGTASGHYVRLASTEDDQAAFTIEINAVTGLVSYHEGFPDFDLVEDMPITE